MFRLAGPFLLFFLALSGCTAGSGDDLAREYQQKTRELGLFPVYPPREEFQIGDVYYWSRSSTNPNDVETVWVHSMPWMRQEAEAFLNTRIVFSPLAAKDALQADIIGGRLRVRGEVSTDSLPISAFPEITADAGFVAGAGIGRIFRALGLSGGNRTTVSLNFNDVRTYWVPNALVATRVRAELAPIAIATTEQAMIDVQRLLNIRRSTPTAACSAVRACGFTVVTRVYLTRNITYTYRSAAILQAAATRFSEGTQQGTTAAQPPTVNVTLNGVGAGTSAELQAELTALQGQVTSLARSQAPGEQIAFQSWDATGLKFSQTFQRPVAIGWDGFDYILQEQKP
jgi:hypothetical protein